MDYSKFRDTSNQGAAVSVNHKALITRALTKYPVDYALFRELLQNSADAQANSAHITFETASSDTSMSQLHGLPIKRLKFSNDGADFTNEDWGRLREIASGNPNETKIGAFGVGFYSVFELSDEPLVHSGKQIMAFKYHGVQLHYYFSDNVATYQKGTMIDLPYRKEEKLPDLVKFIGFLIQTFLLVPLNEIVLTLKYGNGQEKELLKLTKSVDQPHRLRLPKDLEARSPDRMFKLNSIYGVAVVVNIKYLNATQMPPISFSKGIFSLGKQLVTSLITSSGDPEEYTVATLKLTRVDATVDVSVSSKFKAQMIETLLKPPPKQAVMSLLSFDGSPQSSNISEQLKSKIFPKLPSDAKIFIGFPTKQSTGLKTHLALNHVIPTLERTAVDMSNRLVKDWNSEMLYMGGVMARCAYEHELYLVKTHGSSAADANFVLSRFEFNDSTPERLIGLLIQAGFWKCSRVTLVPTTQGIISNSDARLPGDAGDLLRTVPIVTNDTLAAELKKLNLVSEVSYDEIAMDIGSSPVSIDLARKYIQWLVKKWPSLNDYTKVSLLSGLRVQVNPDKILDIASMNYFHDRSKLPDEEVSQNLPPNCLSSEISTDLGTRELTALGYHPLAIDSWAKYRLRCLSEEPNAERKKSIAVGLLRVTSKTWSRMSVNSRSTLHALLNSAPTIPTQTGMKRPRDTYVVKQRIFPHLPVVDPLVDLPTSWMKEIGMRESIDMAFVLEALNGGKLKWTNEDLVKYLTENVAYLKTSDWMVLREGQFFTKVGDAKSHYRASDLYAPDDQLQQLSLPVISYSNWVNDSKEAEVLYSIQLSRFPSAKSLFEHVQSRRDAQIALRYFVRHYEEAKYSYKDIYDLPVIPVENSSALSKPRECYRDPQLKAFGEMVVDSMWEPASARLGIRKRPKIRKLLERVLNDPPKYLTDSEQCDTIFSYFSQNTGEISDDDIRLCQQVAFIPIRSNEGAEKLIEWEKPGSVFFPVEGTDGRDDAMRPLLKTIYPKRSSKPFLILLGVSDKPSLLQVVEMILKDPAKVFSLVKTTEAYEEILATIESKWDVIGKNSKLVDAMKRSPMLLGMRYNTVSSSDASESAGEVSLYAAQDLAIVDDVVIFNQFKDKIVTAPQITTLERLYRRLSVPKLSEILRESVEIGAKVVDENTRTAIEKRIKERMQLFLNNTSKEVRKDYKGVTVMLVKSLSIRRQLPHQEPVYVRSSAYLHPTLPKTILIVPGGEFEWIDVATVLVRQALVRPDQDSAIVLDIQLSSDLESLEKKGYNVARIRQQNKLENMEKRVPALKLRDETQVVDGKKSSTPPAVTPTAPPPVKQDQMLKSSPQPPANKPSQMPPPSSPRPQSQYGPHTSPPSHAPQSGSTKSTIFNKFKEAVMGPTTNGTKTASVDVKRQLDQGLSRAKAFSQSNISAPQNVDAPAPANNDCGSPKKIHQLAYIASTANSMKIYSTSSHPKPRQDELMLSEALNVLCQIFGYPIEAVSIYRDEDTTSIAFNYNGSIFVNSCVQPNLPSLLDYYYPVMAHELAHNLASSHGASHSFYTESYLQTTLASFRSLVSSM